MTHRWACSVPGCKRTVGSQREQEPGDWCLCTKHWPSVPLKWRRALRRIDKRLEKSYRAELQFETQAAYRIHERNLAAYQRISRLIVRTATEQALGIG